MRVLIVDDDDDVRDLLEDLVRRSEFETRNAADGDHALEVYQEFRPDLILLDYQLPGKNGLEVLSEIRRKDSRTLVCIVTAHGSEDVVIEALRHEANDYLRKPVDLKILAPTLERFRKIVKSRERDLEFHSMVVRRRVEMILQNDWNTADDVAGFLTRECEPFLSERDRMKVRLGLSELLINAIEHGNLGVSYEEKTEALQDSFQAYVNFLQERCLDPGRRDRIVKVAFEQDGDRCEWTIEDQGDGFDWRSFGKDPAPEDLHSRHGRGIVLSRFQFDELEYSGKGNVVRVVKRITREE